MNRLEAMLPRADAVERLRAVHEAWARAELEIADQAVLVRSVREVVERGLPVERARIAERQLKAAQAYQVTIGTWATSGAEGLDSMAEVRMLQMARAWLCLRLADADPGALEEARRLTHEVETDPNGLGRDLQPEWDALVTQLRSRR